MFRKKKEGEVKELLLYNAISSAPRGIVLMWRPHHIRVAAAKVLQLPSAKNCVVG